MVRIGLRFKAAIISSAMVLAACGADDAHPNVVLIVIDTLRVDHLGTYGSGADTSPAIDRLATESIVFESAYSTAPWTLPSMASIMTGHYPTTTGTAGQDIKLSESFTTLAEVFSAGGYQTAAFVSHIFVGARFGFDQGFGTFNEEEAGRGHSYVSSPGITRRALDWLRNARNESRPFFLFVHYFDPHYNYIMHPILNTHPEYDGKLLGVESWKVLRAMSRNGEIDDDDKRYLNALYDSEIRFTDHHIGELLEFLRQQGLYDDALVVLTSDHGEELMERRDGWLGHTKRVTQAMIRVPLLWKLPKSEHARRIARDASLVDLAPTLTALAGLGFPRASKMLGRRMLPEEAVDPARGVFSETQRMKDLIAVVTAPFKLVHSRTRRTSRLYDLHSDPEELVNVAAANPGIALRLEAVLETHRARQRAVVSELGIAYEHVELGNATIEALEALGYVE